MFSIAMTSGDRAAAAHAAMATFVQAAIHETNTTLTELQGFSDQLRIVAQTGDTNLDPPIMAQVDLTNIRHLQDWRLLSRRYAVMKAIASGASPHTPPHTVVENPAATPAADHATAEENPAATPAAGLTYQGDAATATPTATPEPTTRRYDARERRWRSRSRSR